MPSRSSSTSTTFRINNVNNPYPVAYDTYNQGRKVTFIWYSGYQTYNVYNLVQPTYSAYSLNSDFVTGGATFQSQSNPHHYNSHQYYPLTYEFYFDVMANSYSGRNISHILFTFTSGVRWVEAAWLRYDPTVINPTGNTQIGIDSSNQWYVKISGVQDSHFSASYHWYLRVRLYTNNNNRVYYNAQVFNYNGQQ